MSQLQSLQQSMQQYWSLVAEPRTSAELSNRGLELLMIGNANAALRYLDRAVEVDPASGPAHFNRASALGRLERYAEELAEYDLAFACGLDIPDLHHNRGLALYNLHRPQEAVKEFDRALESAGKELASMVENSKGLALYDLGSTQEALACYERALEFQPGYTIARLNVGIACLTLGDWARGWEEYEHRWTSAREVGSGYARPASRLPQWNGGQVDPGDRLLVYAEQGFGDTLNFCRLILPAAALFERVTVACQPALVRLLQDSFGDKVEVTGLAPADEAAWRWHCPMLSLPRALHATVQSVPGEVPYLVANPAAVEAWRPRIEAVAGKRRRVGLCWAGGKVHRMDARRSLPFEVVRSLLDGPDIAWFSLQVPADAAAAGAAGMTDWTGELQDFADTAALVAGLDLVITVDTAVAHLAGALGKPVWLLNRLAGDWRWMRGREDSPWYPSMRLFNQGALEDWDPVLERVRLALADFAR